MCGICGIFRPDHGPVDPDRVERMRDVMTPRGPDGFGLSHGSGFAFGHRRLSIIDLSDAGRQPMTNEDGAITLTFNGEIYNFQDLRPELEASGHHFGSHTDSEVLIHGYEQWGLEGLVKRIRGMYAFALHDARRGELHLARDPLGKKPLFFRWDGKELAFASSARALMQSFEATPDVDPTAVDALLWNLYIPGPGTIYEGVEKLLPGRTLSIDRKGNRRDVEFWKPTFSEPERNVSDEEWLERVESGLSAAVRRRLIADVPVGVLLSGGVDSGLVTAIAAQVGGRIKTFSVATEDAALDESGYARAVAERYNTEHHELPVRGTVLDDLPGLVATMGEPLADASAVNLYSIARLARQSVKVVVTGDGGDEAFGGYTHMLAFHMADQVRSRLATSLLPSGAWLGQRLMKPSPFTRLPLVRKTGFLFWYACAPLERTFGQVNWLEAGTREALFTPEFQSYLQERHPSRHYTEQIQSGNGKLLADEVMRVQMRTILPDDYLAKIDSATMATSLEARSPFLDLELIELAQCIPAATRFRNRQPKSVLRRLGLKMLPERGVNRRKQGFVAPVGRWLASDEWRTTVNDLILGPQVEQRGWFRREALERLVQEHRNGKNRAYLLWSILILEMWLNMNGRVVSR